MLIYWAMVEYLPYAGVNITNGGIYTHNPENATALDKDRVDQVGKNKKALCEKYIYSLDNIKRKYKT